MFANPISTGGCSSERKKHQDRMDEGRRFEEMNDVKSRIPKLLHKLSPTPKSYSRTAAFVRRAVIPVGKPGWVLTNGKIVCALGRRK